MRGETIISVKLESAWSYIGDIIVRIVRSDKGLYVVGRKKAGLYESAVDGAGKTIQTRVELSEELLKKILSELEGMKIPAFPPPRVGCDGGYTEMTVGDYGGKAFYRWWSCPPDGWEQLDELAKKIVDLSGIEETP